MRQLANIHPYFFWPALILFGICSGALSEGWKAYAVSSAEAREEVSAVIKYVPDPMKQIKALEEI